MEIQNAQITEIDLGVEDHGQLGICITFCGEGWGQGFGWYGFGRINAPVWNRVHPPRPHDIRSQRLEQAQRNICTDQAR